jgi:CBS domain-containing protein
MPGQIRDLMTVRVVSVRFDEPISTAVDRFIRYGFSALPVVSGSLRLVGIVSLLDVLRFREAHGAEGLQADERIAVEEIMTTDVVWMSATANVGVVAQRLRSNGELRVMPIVQGGRLVGVVTRSDLLRRNDQGSGKDQDGQRAGLRRFFGGRRRDEARDDSLGALARGRRGRRAAPATTPVRDVMTRQTITVRSAQPVALAAELMLHHRHTSLPVVDGDSRLVGIVSEADILAVPQAGRSAAATVGRVMTTTPITVDVGTTVGEARALVADRGLRTVPVIDGDRLVGVLSRSDLV